MALNSILNHFEYKYILNSACYFTIEERVESRIRHPIGYSVFPRYVSPFLTDHVILLMPIELYEGMDALRHTIFDFAFQQTELLDTYG